VLGFEKYLCITWVDKVVTAQVMNMSGGFARVLHNDLVLQIKVLHIAVWIT